MVAGLAALRPSDKGGHYSDYFRSLNSTLQKAGIDKPSLIIDLDRLDRNIDRLVASISEGSHKDYRVVTKSIPSAPLVDYVSKRAGTQSQMVFHRPFLQAMATQQPQSNLLLGKPMPIAAAHKFYQEHRGPFDPERQLQWLVDTPERMAQYLQLAQDRGERLGINLELDVGLHRGGFEPDSGLYSALRLIADNSDHLALTGFMGYDAHVSAIPTVLAEREMAKVKQRYAAAVHLLQADFPQLYRPDLCFNGAGSPTFRLYDGQEQINEVAAGSCLVKPTDFDLPILGDFEAASYIATPVLKRLIGSKLPALESAGSLIRAWDVNKRQTYFAYGGKWMAKVESPPGITPHFAYVSSNQQGYNASEKVDIGVDDYLFLRPTQSEAVLLQFNDLLAVRNGSIVDRWPVLSELSA